MCDGLLVELLPPQSIAHWSQKDPLQCRSDHVTPLLRPSKPHSSLRTKTPVLTMSTGTYVICPSNFLFTSCKPIQRAFEAQAMSHIHRSTISDISLLYLVHCSVHPYIFCNARVTEISTFPGKRRRRIKKNMSTVTKLESWLYHLSAVWPWGSHLASLNLIFLCILWTVNCKYILHRSAIRIK